MDGARSHRICDLSRRIEAFERDGLSSVATTGLVGDVQDMRSPRYDFSAEADDEGPIDVEESSSPFEPCVRDSGTGDGSFVIDFNYDEQHTSIVKSNGFGALAARHSLPRPGIVRLR